MINDEYTFNNVSDMDYSLQQLAAYEVCHGKIIMPTNEEEIYLLNKKIISKFNYFKKLIQSGECTFDFIKENVLKKNGPFPPIKNNILNEINSIVNFDEENIVNERKKTTICSDKIAVNLTLKILNAFIPDLKDEEKNAILSQNNKKNTKKNHRK